MERVARYVQCVADSERLDLLMLFLSDRVSERVVLSVTARFFVITSRVSFFCIWLASEAAGVGD